MAPRLVLVTTLFGVLAIAACGGGDNSAAPDRARNTAAAPGSCPDPKAAADHVTGLLPVYDYQGSASPADLASRAGTVVVGDVADAGSGDGWHPPILVDGAVIRRSGVRAVDEIETYGAPERHLDGILAYDGECLYVERDGERRTLVWPPGTSWDPAAFGVELDDGSIIREGQALVADGIEAPAFSIRYEIGADAGDRIEACTPFATNEMIPVLIAATVRSRDS